MTITVRCKCGRKLRLSSKVAGRKIACPVCKRPFRIPIERFGADVPTDGSKRAPAAGTTSAESAGRAGAPAPAKPPPALANLDDVIGALDSGESVEPAPVIAADLDLAQSKSAIGQRPHTPDGPTCPSCSRVLPARAKICVQCGVNIATGRSLLTAEDGHLDTAYTAAGRIIWVISWVIFFGIYPVASEAFGTRKPWLIRSVAVLTILTSVWFWVYDWSGSTKMQSYKNLMLWPPDAEPDPDQLLTLYSYTSYGDRDAFLSELGRRVRAARKERGDDDDRGDSVAPDEAASLGLLSSEDYVFTLLGQDPDPDALIVEAHQALPPRQRFTGEFHAYQLLTNAFLHGGILHLAGNLLFLMVFGARVNALIGNLPSAILYPALAIAGSIGHMLSAAGGPPIPALGASGAIMGLAGMYLVFFPVHKVHMAIWIRLPLIMWFRLAMKLFAVRGFWVVLFYIAFDVFYTVAGIDDGVAHWAHLGGFIAGVTLALILILTRLVNARGGDILSVVLGRRAWPLVGRPDRA